MRALSLYLHRSSLFFIFSFGVVAIFSHSLPRFLIFALCSFLLNSFVREKKKKRTSQHFECGQIACERAMWPLSSHNMQFLLSTSEWCMHFSAVQWIHFVPSLCVRLCAWVSECVWACLIVHLVHTNVHWKNCHSNQRAQCLYCLNIAPICMFRFPFFYAYCFDCRETTLHWTMRMCAWNSETRE